MSSEATASARPGMIYCVTNAVNGKRYIGQTVQELKSRWASHRCDAEHGSESAFHRAIRKHGVDNFTVEVVAESFEPFLNDLEEMCISLYSSRTTGRRGYNENSGGEGGGTRSPETRRKMSAWQVGRKLTEETRRKISEARRGPRSPETLRKIAVTYEAKKVARLQTAQLPLAA